MLGLGLAKKGEVFCGFEIHTNVTQRVFALMVEVYTCSPTLFSLSSWVLSPGSHRNLLAKNLIFR